MKAFPNPEISQSLGGVREKIEAMIGLTDTTIDTVRRIASELRPVALDALGLAARRGTERDSQVRSTTPKIISE